MIITNAKYKKVHGTDANGSVTATIDGVVRKPSAFVITFGWPPSIAATTEFVVPKSIPTTFPIIIFITILSFYN